MKLVIQSDGKFSEAYPSTKSYIGILSELEFPSLQSVQQELKNNGPPFYKFSDIDKLAIEGNPLFSHASINVKNELQILYEKLIKKHNPDIANKLFVDTRINDIYIESLPFIIKELPIREQYSVNDFSRIVAKLVAKE